MPMPVLVVLVGLGLAAAGGYLVLHARRLVPADRSGWVRVRGTVVAWTSDPDRFAGVQTEQLTRRVKQFPVVEYPLPDGSTGRFASATTWDLGTYPTGTPATVLVDPADPHRAELADAQPTVRTVSCLHAAIGTVLLAAGLVLVAGALLVLLR